MSTWTSRLGPILICAAVGFPAAADIKPPTDTPIPQVRQPMGVVPEEARPAAPAAPKPAPRALQLLNGGIVIQGPTGYCFDMTVLRSEVTNAFVVLGSCAALEGKGQQGKQSAILTATVTSADAPGAPLAQNFPAMAAFLQSEPGRAAISRAGDARSVRVVSVSAADEVLYLRAADAAAAVWGQPVEQDYWRAIFEVNGKYVTLTTLGLKDRPLGAAEKRRLLEAFVRSVRKANDQ